MLIQGGVQRRPQRRGTPGPGAPGEPPSLAGVTMNNRLNNSNNARTDYE